MDDPILRCSLTAFRWVSGLHGRQYCLVMHHIPCSRHAQTGPRLPAGKATPAGQVPAFLPADYDSPVPIMSGPPVATGTPALPQQGLVPYPMGSAASHQRTPMTRFAAEALAQPKQSNGSAQAAAGEGAADEPGRLEGLWLTTTSPHHVPLLSQQGTHPGESSC